MAGLPELPDVWAPVGTTDLPSSVENAYQSKDWKQLRIELATLMDTAITDGVYGRALLQLVLSLPAGLNPVFDRYRIAAMIDHGDWDGLRNAAKENDERHDIRGIRDILTANLEQTALPPWAQVHERQLLQIYEFQAQRAVGRMRHWAQEISGVNPKAFWNRQDVAIGRHLRYRQLHDAMMLAIAESQGGRLPVAHALAREAQRLGDEAEQFRVVAYDLEDLLRLAMGDRHTFELRIPARICDATGPSPVGTWEISLYVLPFVALRDDDSLLWFARLAGHIAARLASPRWQLQSDSWRVAGDLRVGTAGNKTELAGLVARARRATPGLRALPAFLSGYADRRYEAFEEAERLARQSGNVWLQVSALTWMSALDPKVVVSRRLRRLLDITGWRRPSLVPTEIAADAALGMTSAGERSEAVLELALAADRPNVTTEVVRRHIDDAETSSQIRLAAVDALGRIKTTHAREILARLALRRDDVGTVASRVVSRPAIGLSEREIEVLSLAGDGLTNKQIADKLFLSPHTVARHLSNARGKLGASNRAEAAVLLRRPSE